jgi:hypothetical protein
MLMRNYYAMLGALCLSLVSLPALAEGPRGNGAGVQVTQQADGHSRVSQRTKSTASDDARYKQREAESAKAQDYRGGDTIVIGTSAAVVILCVVLLVVLL